MRQNDIAADELMLIATLKKPYGIKGWLWVFSETEDHAAIFAMPNWQIKTATGFKPLTVKEWRKQGAGLVACFHEIPDRNTAERMNGTTVWADKCHLPTLADDEYYWADLVGLAVVNTQNDCLGVIKNLFETGANDVMTIAPAESSVDNEERLIPWHKSVVKNIDLATQTMIVDWDSDF